jgi:hypothetical protein
VVYGLTPEEVLAHADIPIFMKRREFIDINELDKYLAGLRERISKKTEVI